MRSLKKKKIQKVLMKIEEMADVFLNSANFASHAFLTLETPSDYALNLPKHSEISHHLWTFPMLIFYMYTIFMHGMLLP